MGGIRRRKWHQNKRTSTFFPLLILSGNIKLRVSIVRVSAIPLSSWPINVVACRFVLILRNETGISGSRTYSITELSNSRLAFSRTRYAPLGTWLHPMYKTLRWGGPPLIPICHGVCVFRRFSSSSTIFSRLTDAPSIWSQMFPGLSNQPSCIRCLQDQTMFSYSAGAPFHISCVYSREAAGPSVWM